MNDLAAVRVGVEVLALREKALNALSYDPQTGEFKWAVAPGRGAVRVGDIAGRKSNNGYRQIGLGGRIYLAHRLAWLVVYGEWPKCQIDHINGIKDDNRISNLRDVTIAQNSHAIFKPQPNNRTGFRGVTFNKWIGKFHAKITKAGKTLFLGYFRTAEEASAAYLSAKQQIHHSSHASRPYFIGGPNES